MVSILPWLAALNPVVTGVSLMPFAHDISCTELEHISVYISVIAELNTCSCQSALHMCQTYETNDTNYKALQILKMNAYYLSSREAFLCKV